MKKKLEYSSPKFTEKELLKIFPEAKKIIPLKIKECEEHIKNEEMKISNVLNKVYALETDSFSEWFAEEMVRILFMTELKKYDERLLALKKFKSLINPQKQPSDNFQEDLERARIYPIYESARDKLVLLKRGKNFVSLCPFHNETTPSLYIYTESNRYHCFGCQENGDVIKLTMALHGINFKEAVALLKN